MSIVKGQAGPFQKTHTTRGRCRVCLHTVAHADDDHDDDDDDAGGGGDGGGGDDVDGGSRNTIKLSRLHLSQVTANQQLIANRVQQGQQDQHDE